MGLVWLELDLLGREATFSLNTSFELQNKRSWVDADHKQHKRLIQNRMLGERGKTD